MASKSVTGVRTPKLVETMENSVIDRVIVEINELTDVVGNNVEVPRDPFHINTYTGKKTKAMDI